MRTYEGASVALVALVRIPYRNVDCQASLLVSCQTHVDMTILVVFQDADREIVAHLSVDWQNEIIDDPRISCRLSRRILAVRPFCRDFYFLVSFHTRFNAADVHFYNCVAFGSVLLSDRVLHFHDCLRLRNDFSDGEEGRLENGVLVAAEADLFRDLRSVDHVEFDVSLRQQSLDLR